MAKSKKTYSVEFDFPEGWNYEDIKKVINPPQEYRKRNGTFSIYWEDKCIGITIDGEKKEYSVDAVFVALLRVRINKEPLDLNQVGLLLNIKPDTLNKKRGAIEKAFPKLYDRTPERPSTSVTTSDCQPKP